jgi:ABC-type Fe3+-hydroxamate transport system substrate-binding protein
VYYGRGVNGLETGLAGSINLGVLERLAAVNVAAVAGTGGLTKVSIEQVLSWNPDVILALDPAFYQSVASDPLWASVKAMQNKRIYLAPNLPYGWLTPRRSQQADRCALAPMPSSIPSNSLRSWRKPHGGSTNSSPD